MKQKTAGGSAVLGYDLKLTKDLSIKPFVGYGVQLNPEHSVNIDGAEIKSKKSISHGLKYGVQADYEIKIEDLKVKPFVKVSVAELKGKSKVSVNESSDFVMKKSKQVSAEVGLELKYKNFTMAASAETSKGNNFKKNTQAKLQFGLTF